MLHINYEEDSSITLTYSPFFLMAQGRNCTVALTD